MSERTPGNWSVEYRRPADEGVAVASDHDFTTNTGKTYRVFVAQYCKPMDAQLIAAAPDLYAALEAMVTSGPDFNDDGRDVFEIARLALAKARGTT